MFVVGWQAWAAAGVEEVVDLDMVLLEEAGVHRLQVDSGALREVAAVVVQCSHFLACQGDLQFAVKVEAHLLHLVGAVNDYIFFYNTSRNQMLLFYTCKCVRKF